MLSLLDVRFAAGNTELMSASRLSHKLGFRDLRLKLEGQNPTGTHKDRIAALLVSLALRAGKAGVTVGSCGNLGAAVARACLLANLRCHVFLPERYGNSRRAEIMAYGSAVTLVPGTYEDAVCGSTLHAAGSGYFDLSPEGAMGCHMISACRPIAREILASIGTPPDSMWVPVGNGTTLAGIYAGFREERCSPRMGAVGSCGNTAATASMMRRAQVELEPSELRETGVNEPLVNWRSFHGLEAQQAVHESGGWACEASDAALIEASSILRSTEAIAAPPFACAGLAGLLLTGDTAVGANGTHVILLTA